METNGLLSTKGSDCCLLPDWPKHVVMTSFSCELMVIFNLMYILSQQHV